MKNYIIIINENLPYEDQRVTAAHELGHIILHGKTNSFQLTECTDIPIERLENEIDRIRGDVDALKPKKTTKRNNDGED